MEDYNKIIESIGVKYIKARKLDILQPVYVSNFYDIENTLVLLHEGVISFGKTYEQVAEGDLLFLPAGKMLGLGYGASAKQNPISNEEFLNDREKYLRHHSPSAGLSSQQENFSYLAFEAKVFDSINFFSSLDIPAFVISDHRIANLMREIITELGGNKTGKARMVQTYTEQILIELVRYILRNQLFVEQLATNSTYFKDPRLVDILTYIKNELRGDLSNKVLATVANVSEDYVGQYFKMLTGINPQDYIEYQRMERAVHLLRTSKKSIRSIGSEVGYKDTAYFCRRFKMMFGIPAGKMRRRESMISS